MKAKKVRIEIAPWESWGDRLERDVEHARKHPKEPPIRSVVFPSIDDLRRVLTRERIRLLRLIRAKRPGSVYELAKLAGRERATVIRDLEVLQELGLVSRARIKGPGRLRTPPRVSYDEIQIAVAI